MLVVRGTATLLKKLRASPAGESAGPDTTTLGEWYANHVKLGRHGYVLFYNAATHAVLIVNASPANTLFDRFREHLGRFLYTLGVSSEDIRSEINATSDVTLAPTADRSLRGSMVRFTRDLPFMCRAHEERTGSPLDDLESELAFRIEHPLGDAYPADIVRARFGLPRPGELKLVEPPRGSIRVRRVLEDDWEFSFPRIGSETIERLYDTIERANTGFVHGPQLVLERIIREYPECIAAMDALAEILDDCGSKPAAGNLWRHAEAIGRRALPRNFQIARDCLPWGLLGNRSYLRVCAGLAGALERSGLTDDAEGLYVEMLALNPDDNQGIRQRLADLRLRNGDHQGVLEICDAYRNDDTSASLLYGRVLALFRMGRHEKAHEALFTAAGRLPLVAQEIARTTHIPPPGVHPDQVTIGGADQAFHYWMRTGEAWTTTPGAIEFVASFLAEQRGSTTPGGGARRTENVVLLGGTFAADPPIGEFLSDEQVNAVAERLRRSLVEGIPGAGVLDETSAGRAVADSVRFQQLGLRLRQTREAAGLSLKEIASKLKVPRYRLSGVEEPFPRSIKPDIFWEYCEFLELEAFAQRWIEANKELATRLGIEQPPV